MYLLVCKRTGFAESALRMSPSRLECKDAPHAETFLKCLNVLNDEEIKSNLTFKICFSGVNKSPEAVRARSGLYVWKFVFF